MLEQFAANCPVLEQLVLPGIDDSGSDVYPAYEPYVEPQHRLRTFFIGHLDVNCTLERFTGYLLELFPKLRMFKPTEDWLHLRYYNIYDKALRIILEEAIREQAEEPSYAGDGNTSQA